jgi:hypothetical protein
MLRWGKALEIVAALPRAPHSAALEYILNGFRAISTLLMGEEEKLLADHFLNRGMHEIIAMKLSSESVGGYANFVNAFEEDVKTKFH